MGFFLGFFFIYRAHHLGCLELARTVSWKLWHNRNVCFYEGLCQRPNILIAHASQMVLEARSTNSTASSQTSTAQTGWCPPLDGHVKLKNVVVFESS